MALPKVLIRHGTKKSRTSFLHPIVFLVFLWLGEPVGVGVKLAVVALPVGILLPVRGVFQSLLPLVEFEPKVGDFFRHFLIEVFLLRDVVGQVVESGWGVDVDEELPVAFADGGAAHRHAPVEGFVRSFFNLATEEGKEVSAIVVDDLLSALRGDAGREL